MYYLRTKPAAQAIQFTVDKTRLASAKVSGKTGASPRKTKPEKSSSDMKHKGGDENKENEKEQSQRSKNMAMLACSLQNKEECLMCGS